VSEKYPDDRGALWIESDDKMTGTINGEKVVAWRNTKKVGKQPDWRIKVDKRQAAKSGEAETTTYGHEVSDQDVPF